MRPARRPIPATLALAALTATLALAATLAGGCDRLLPPHEAAYDPHLDCDSGPCKCAASYADCNQAPADGCEVETDRDPENCGGCEIDCRGGSCVDGRCEAVTVYAARGFTALSFALSGDRVFVTDTEAAVIALQPDGDKLKPKVLADFYPDEHRGGLAVAVDETRQRLLYAINDPLPGEGEEHLFWVSIDEPLKHEGVHARGDEVTVFAEDTQATLQIPGITRDYAYLVDAAQHLCRLELTRRDLTCFEEKVYGVRALADRAYWFDAEGLHVNVDGAKAPKLLLSTSALPGESDAFNFAADGDEVFFLATSLTPEQIDLLTYHAGDPAPHRVTSFAGVLWNKAGGVHSWVDVDARYVYVVTGSLQEQAIWRVPRGAFTANPERLAPRLGGVSSFRVGDEAIYWSQYVLGAGTYIFGGTLHRLLKPAPLALPLH